MANLHLADEGVFRLGLYDYLKTATGDYYAYSYSH